MQDNSHLCRWGRALVITSAMLGVVALFLLTAVDGGAQSSGDIEFPSLRTPTPIYKPSYSPNRGAPRGRVAIVDQQGTSGRYRTIQAAVNAVGSGGTVRVMSGAQPYTDALRISYPVSIRSYTEGAQVDIRSPYDLPCLHVNSASNGLVSVSGMKWLKPSNELDYRARPCIIVERGFFSLKDSYVEATIHNPAILLQDSFSRIEATTITNGQVGVRIDAAPDGDYFLIGNNIVGNVDGIRVNGRAHVTVLGNHVHDNIEHGIVSVGGGGTYLSNWIYRNGESGVLLQRSVLAPEFRANFISRNNKAGIRVWPDANGVISWNQICNNADRAIDGLKENNRIVLDPPNDIFNAGSGDGLFRSGDKKGGRCTLPPSPLGTPNVVTGSSQ